MDTAIVLKGNEKPVIIPHTDWCFSKVNKNTIIVVDEVDHDNIVGNFDWSDIAGVYTINDVRVNSYDDQDLVDES